MALTVHLGVQRDGRDAVHRAGSSASAYSRVSLRRHNRCLKLVDLVFFAHRLSLERTPAVNADLQELFYYALSFISSATCMYDWTKICLMQACPYCANVGNRARQ